MSRSFGSFNAGGAGRYYVYESNTAVKAVGDLPGLSAKKLKDLFVDGQVGNNTTIWKDATYRLDKQNPNATVKFTAHNVDAADFNNLSIQSGDASLAVLYLEAGFTGVADHVTDFRVPFVNFKANHADHQAVHFLRMLFTWLLISNKRNKKYCITSQANFIVNDAAANQALDTLVTQTKTAAKDCIA